MSIIVASGLPGLATFISVPPLAPPPNQSPTDLAFGNVLTIPANFTNRMLRISASGSIQISGGNVGSGLVGVSLCDIALTKPPIQSASTNFRIDLPQVIPFGLENYVWLDGATGRIRDINTASPALRSQFTGALPRGGSFFGTQGIPSFTDAAGRGSVFDTSGPYRTGTQAVFDFTVPTPLQVLAEIWNSGEQGLNLPTLSFQLTTFQLEY